MLWKICFWLMAFLFIVIIMPMIAAAAMASVFNGVDAAEMAAKFSNNALYIWAGSLLWALIPAYD